MKKRGEYTVNSTNKISNEKDINLSAINGNTKEANGNLKDKKKYSS